MSRARSTSCPFHLIHLSCISLAFAYTAYACAGLHNAICSKSILFTEQGVLLALVSYEYILTWQDEVGFVWQRKWSGSSVLFMVNRYLMIVNVVVLVSPVTNQVRLRTEISGCDGALLIVSVVSV